MENNNLFLTCAQFIVIGNEQASSFPMDLKWAQVYIGQIFNYSINHSISGMILIQSCITP